MNDKAKKWNAISLWIGLASLSVSWVLLLPYYSPSTWLGVSAFFTGTALFGVSFCSSSVADTLGTSLKQYITCAVPLALIAARIPFPENLGLCVIACGLVLPLFANRLPRIAAGLVAAGIVMTMQALALPLFVAFESRYHHIGFLEPVVRRILQVFAVPAAPCAKGVFISTPGYAFTLATTSEKLNLLLLTMIFVGWITIRVILKKANRENMDNMVHETGHVLTMLAAFFFTRYVLLLLITVSYRNYDIFWLPTWVLGSFLPLSIMPAWRGFAHALNKHDPGDPKVTTQDSSKLKRQEGAAKTHKHQWEQ